MTTDAITDLLIAATKAARAREAAHAAVWANPKNAALVPALQAAMRAEREARVAYETAAGRVLDLHDAYTATAIAAEKAMDKHMDRNI